LIGVSETYSMGEKYRLLKKTGDDRCNPYVNKVPLIGNSWTMQKLKSKNELPKGETRVSWAGQANELIEGRLLS